MDILCKRFPLVVKRVLDNLDDQSLIRSKEASRRIAESLDNEKSYWIRILKKHNEKFTGCEESWREVIHKVPIDFVKQLAIAVQQVFKYFWCKKQVAPLHIAVEVGSFQLCQYVISKTKNKNPADNDGRTPIHKAAMTGRLDILLSDHFIT